MKCRGKNAGVSLEPPEFVSVALIKSRWLGHIILNLLSFPRNGINIPTLPDPFIKRLTQCPVYGRKAVNGMLPVTAHTITSLHLISLHRSLALWARD